jgi:ABC-type lipoprotein release transport system permease subunit
LSVWPFIFAGISALLIAWLTVILQAVRAVKANPAEVLRYE